MNKTQIFSILTPIIGVLATFLASKFPLLDQATWNTLVTSVATGVVTGVLAYINRGTALVDTVSQLTPDTKVVTSPDIARALPANNDVVSSTEAKVVAK